LAGELGNELGDGVDRPDDVIAGVADGDGAVIKQRNAL